ncbi:MAG: hypothetical protein IJX99_07960 [Clostridia bacterium]|nr:hypothetical protein [Clostridia bacterium]
MISIVISTVISALLSGGLYYLAQPALNFASGGFWWFLFGVGVIFTIVEWLGFYIADECCYNAHPLPAIIASGFTGLVAVVGVILFLASTEMFQANDYRNAHEVKLANEGVAVSALPAVDTKDDIPVIDVYTAAKLGDRAMGVMEKYLSQYEVSNEYTLIEYNGEFFRISPLEYGGFWKYNNSKATGIPGYVMVNIYSGEAKLVELPAELAIRYAPSAFWGKDMFRHLRGQYGGTIFGDYHFEIDETGTPYYIISTMKPTAGVFGASVVNGVIIMNAATGESQKFALSNVPEWVDNVYSIGHLMEEIDWHFSYIHGAFNFSNKDVRRTSYYFDHSQYYMYPDGGDVILYTGVTSAGNDESNIGFILANMRTGEITYYAAPGAEESSAQASAKGLVQQYGYSAGPVMLVNIDGIESYFLTLKDNQGLVKRYALVNKEDYNIVAVEEMVDKVVFSYRQKVTTLEAQGDAGVVESVYEAVINGNTTYIFKLVGIDTYYLSDISVSYAQHSRLTAGTTVELSYIEQSDVRIVENITFK